MEKAIEIKRRAQRCIQNGDLDGALAEYEKLVGSEESDPYNFVLLADLLFKKGESSGAAERYLAAVSAYEKAGLYKNAIAVCKKMLRLTLAPAKVLQALAQLHALDGLAGEASLYHVQYAEYMVRANEPGEAAHALRLAFDVCQDNIKVLEQLAEAWLLAGENTQAAATLIEAAGHYRSRAQEHDAQRVTDRALTLDPQAGTRAVAAPETAVAEAVQEKSTSDPISLEMHVQAPSAWAATGDALDVEQTTKAGATPAHSAPAGDRIAGLDTGRHHVGPPRLPGLHDEPATEAPEALAEATPGTNGVHADAVAEVPAAHAGPEAAAGIDAAEAEAATEESYEQIAAQLEPQGDESSVEASDAADADGAPAVYAIDDEEEPVAAVETPQSPGLAFGTPVTAVQEPDSEEMGMANVERLLAKAQEQFRSGDREQASLTLADAAQAYEAIGRFDSAVTIYRSLGRGAHSTTRIMELWLANCEAREDMSEAGQVACELGDVSLNQNDPESARGWFQRAVSYDTNNELARRRLQRLDSPSMPPPEPVAHVAPVAPAPHADPAAEGGRVEVAVGRGEAVTFDLSGLLAEFQRGVESQLAGDAQSHYDLGMTYREMGLLEQAVDSFRVAERDPRLMPRSLEMIGRCFDDQGRHAEAATEYRRAVGAPGVSTDTLAELRMQLAKALANSGDAAGAEAELKQIDAALAADPDLAERVDELRRSLGPS